MLRNDHNYTGNGSNSKRKLPSSQSNGVPPTSRRMNNNAAVAQPYQKRVNNSKMKQQHYDTSD